jgi:hypothetical protein
MTQQIFTTIGHILSNSFVSWKLARIPKICGLKTLVDLQDIVQTSVEMIEGLIEDLAQYKK